jgi:hypothetical protein
VAETLVKLSLSLYGNCIVFKSSRIFMGSIIVLFTHFRCGTCYLKTNYRVLLILYVGLYTCFYCKLVFLLYVVFLKENNILKCKGITLGYK